jgi:hypothetical protein
MIRLCQLAVAALGGVVLSIGVTGCSHDGPISLDSNAVLAAEGAQSLAYTAPMDGAATVYDVQGDEIVYTGKLTKGDRIAADIEHDQIIVSGRVVAQPHLDRQHERRIYFEPTPPAL